MSGRFLALGLLLSPSKILVYHLPKNFLGKNDASRPHKGIQRLLIRTRNLHQHQQTGLG